MARKLVALARRRRRADRAGHRRRGDRRASSAATSAAPCSPTASASAMSAPTRRAAPSRPGTASRSTSTSPSRPSPRTGPDGNYPLMMMFHGYGGDKLGLGAMQHWLDRGYATFSMTDRGFHESCGSAASQARLRPGLRQRLHPPDRQPLRGPRRAGVRRPARRRGPDRPAADRRDRRLLRRRHVDGARRAAQPQGDARLQHRPVDEPGRQADADRGRGAEHPLDRPRLLAAAERQHARLRRRRALPGPDRGREAVVRRRPLLRRAQAAPGFYAPVGTDPTADITGLAELDRGRRALRSRSRRRSSTRSPSTTPRTTSTTRSPRRRC